MSGKKVMEQKDSMLGGLKKFFGKATKIENHTYQGQVNPEEEKKIEVVPEGQLLGLELKKAMKSLLLKEQK